MACRICFETHDPLYTPCKCKGSIEYIHEECLFEWIKLDPDRSSCELCKAPYLLDYNRPFEKDIIAGPLRQYLLINPSWHIAAFCASIIIIQQHFQFPPSKPLFLLTQYIYHSLYISCCALYIRFHIHQPILYYQTFDQIHGYRLVYVHFTLLLLLLSLSITGSITSLVFLNVVNQCYLGVYPMLHSTILQEMNRTRRIIIKNRTA